MGITDHAAERTEGPAGDGADAPVALVPLRTGGKSRLGQALATGQREALVLAMLDDVVTALRAAGVEDVRILAGDASAARAAEERDLPALLDPPDGAGAADADDRGRIVDALIGPTPGDRSLRAAVDAALRAIPTTSVRLVVAADLPRLDPDEVRRVLSDPAEVVIAPTLGGGTALLRLAPGVLITTRYGPGSAAGHAEESARAGRSVALLDLTGASQDVDDGADLLALRSRTGGATGPATAAFLAGGRG